MLNALCTCQEVDFPQYNFTLSALLLYGRDHSSLVKKKANDLVSCMRHIMHPFYSDSLLLQIKIFILCETRDAIYHLLIYAYLLFLFAAVSYVS